MKEVKFGPTKNLQQPKIFKSKPLDTRQLIALGVGTVVAAGLIGSVASAFKK